MVYPFFTGWLPIIATSRGFCSFLMPPYVNRNGRSQTHHLEYMTQSIREALAVGAVFFMMTLGGLRELLRIRQHVTT